MMCGSCHKDLHSSQSIICEACLTWYHLRCAGLAVAPKKTDWFCRICHSTDVLIERKKATTERKVNNYYRKPLNAIATYMVTCEVISHEILKTENFVFTLSRLSHIICMM